MSVERGISIMKRGDGSRFVTVLPFLTIVCFSYRNILLSNSGFGIAVIISIIISFIVGVGTYFWVQGKSVNFFVAGRSLPLWVVAMTLGAQSIDSNAILGNADLSYRFGFWDGAVIPM
jgi:hypothetical protein